MCSLNTTTPLQIKLAMMNIQKNSVFVRKTNSIQNKKTGFKSKFNKYKGYCSCNMSYAILSKIVITRKASSKFVKAVFINRRATNHRVCATREFYSKFIVIHRKGDYGR